MRSRALSPLIAFGLVACHGDKDGARALSIAPVMARPAAARTAAAEPSGAASTNPFRFVGRTQLEPSGGLRFAWSGSRVETRFTGPSLDVELEDDGSNAFEIVLDGNLLRHLRTSRGRKTYHIVEGAAPGDHVVSVGKRTEAMVGEAVFFGFHASARGEIRGAPSAPGRRLEIIGDSITAGLGNEGKDPCAPPAESQNDHQTYGEMAGRALSADVVNLAWSGIRVSGTAPTMQDLYPRTLPGHEDSVWRFPGPPPDAVVINLGDNDDFWSEGAAGAFREDYLRFVRAVRTRYPRALILCTTGPMGTGNSEAARRTIASAVGALGDPRAFYLEFAPILPEAEGVGCGAHPTVKTHARMAETLSAALKSRLGW